jgi:hypothetical protein
MTENEWKMSYTFKNRVRRTVFFFSLLGFELRASCLLNWYSTAWATPSAHFAVVILKVGAHFLLKTAWTTILLFCFLPVLGWQVHTTMSSFFLFRWSFTNFFPGLALNHSSPDLRLPNSWYDRHTTLHPDIVWDVIFCKKQEGRGTYLILPLPLL